MKKVISVFVLTVMVVSVLLAVAGCSGNSGMQQNSDNSALLAEIEELKDRVEDLENKNNVFWTDKAEYAEDETMTIYFKNIAIVRIRLNMINDGAAFWISGKVINANIYVTSLVRDIYADSVLATSYLEWDNGVCMRNESVSPEICRQNIEVSTGGNYAASDAIANNVVCFDFIICVPGTAFEIARFANVRVNK